MAKRHFQKIFQDDIEQLSIDLARVSKDLDGVLRLMKAYHIDSVMSDGLKTCVDNIRRYDNLTREVGAKVIREVTALKVAEIQAQYMTDDPKE